MTRIVFVSHDGQAQAVQGEDGQSLMTVAVANNVPGIDADCGGACACATCHVFVDDAWFGRTGVASDMEQSMLSFAEGVRPTSRLACQIDISAALDGLTVHLPEAQH